MERANTVHNTVVQNILHAFKNFSIILKTVEELEQ